jgi:hypothetical protein
VQIVALIGMLQTVQNYHRIDCPSCLPTKLLMLAANAQLLALTKRIEVWMSHVEACCQKLSLGDLRLLLASALVTLGDT